MINLLTLRAGQVIETCGLTVNHEMVPDGRRFTVERDGAGVLLIHVVASRRVVPIVLSALAEGGVVYGFREVDHG